MSANRNHGIGNLIELLDVRAHDDGDEVAFTFLPDRSDVSHSLTYRDLQSRALGLAAELQDAGAHGERAIVVGYSSIDFIVAFYASILSGAIAVPVPPPRPRRPLDSFGAIAESASARFILAPSGSMEEFRTRAGDIPALRDLRWIASDCDRATAAAQWRDPGRVPGDIAYLQYTSGSTRTPRGVMISHENALANLGMIDRAFRYVDDAPALGWLPLYHDMGLVGIVLAPVFIGTHSVFMSPFSFLQRPVRWLRGISDYRAAVSGGPNFAYELAARSIRPDQLDDIDLSCWELAFCGAEPVRPDTLAEFARTFAPIGFRKAAFYPCYGLAEGTLFVTGGDQRCAATARRFDRDVLARGIARPAAPRDDNPAVLVNCGRPWNGLEVVIVDPETSRSVPDGTVGEIWIAGKSIAAGYWNRADDTQRTFGARIVDDDDREFLRTGDLGFWLDGGLYVTGRIKDLIIVDGRNHYPQDIERTAEQAHPAVCVAGAAAFAVDDGDSERLTIVVEADLRAGVGDRKSASDALADEIVDAIRQRVAETHDVSPAAVALVGRGKLPKTTSGKVRRQSCRAAFLSGDLPVTKCWRRSLRAAADHRRRGANRGPSGAAEATL